MGNIRAVLGKPFLGTYVSAYIVLGAVATLVSPVQLFTAAFICLIPGVVERSWQLSVKGFCFGLLVSLATAMLGLLFICNGRWSLPMVLIFTPGVFAITPYYDHLPFGWQERSLFLFTVFFFLLEFTLFYLLTGRVKPSRLFWRAFFSSVVVMWILYPLSWLGMLSGTFNRPLNPLWHYAISLALFLAIYPVALIVFFRIVRGTHWTEPKR